MTEEMTKEQLVEQSTKLKAQLSEIFKKISNYETEELKKKYGDKLTCEFCRFNAVSGFSGDGWHNTCATGNCTCCNKFCEEYAPDNKSSLLIKGYSKPLDSFLRSNNSNGYGSITEDEFDALDELDAQIFVDEPSEYTLKILTLFLEHKHSNAEVKNGR